MDWLYNMSFQVSSLLIFKRLLQIVEHLFHFGGSLFCIRFVRDFPQGIQQKTQESLELDILLFHAFSSSGRIVSEPFDIKVHHFKQIFKGEFGFPALPQELLQVVNRGLLQCDNFSLSGHLLSFFLLLSMVMPALLAFMLEADAHEAFELGLLRFAFQRGENIGVGAFVKLQGNVRCMRLVVSFLRCFFAFGVCHNLSV